MTWFSPTCAVCKRLHNIQWWEFLLCLRKKGPRHPIVFYGKVHGIMLHMCAFATLSYIKLCGVSDKQEGKLSLIIIMYVQLWVAIIKLWIISCPGNTWSLFMYGQEIVLMDTHEVHYMLCTTLPHAGFAHLERAHVYSLKTYTMRFPTISIYPQKKEVVDISKWFFIDEVCFQHVFHACRAAVRECQMILRVTQQKTTYHPEPLSQTSADQNRGHSNWTEKQPWTSFICDNILKICSPVYGSPFAILHRAYIGLGWFSLYYPWHCCTLP